MALISRPGRSMRGLRLALAGTIVGVALGLPPGAMAGDGGPPGDNTAPQAFAIHGQTTVIDQANLAFTEVAGFVWTGNCVF